MVGTEGPKKPWHKRRPGYQEPTGDWPPQDPQPRAQKSITTPTSTPGVEPAPFETERSRDWRTRGQALADVEAEEKKPPPENRLSKARRERIQRMRSPLPRRAEKRNREKESATDHAERVRRINVLLRAGVYTRDGAANLPDVFTVLMTREGSSGNPEVYEVEVRKSDVEQWLAALTPYERQRVYVLGRKKIDFKLRREDYPDKTDEEFEREKVFQKEQKLLADALEIVALPMLRTIFRSMDHNVRVYLTSANDDIAGGLDVAIDFYNRKGKRLLFHDGTPMRFVVDMTYARMREKIDVDLERGKISKKAYDVLKGDDEKVPPELANARAMKIFRTVVETIGGTMSTMTFDKKGPLETPQEHVPRLIIGLDWETAFSAISDWVQHGDNFGPQFKESDLAKRIEESIKNQLKGLHALTSRYAPNSNTPYLADLLKEMRFKVLKPRLGQSDQSLDNIDRLLTLETETRQAWARRRLEQAVLAEIATRGLRTRGDMHAAIVTDTMPKKADPQQKNEATESVPYLEQIRRKLEEVEVEILKRKLQELLDQKES